MANQEHVDALKKGAAAWNEWRAVHPDAWPDFNGADFSMDAVDLMDADLTRADFREAALNGLDFSKARLRGANFAGADLRGGRLAGDLSGTNFFRSKMSNMHLVAVSHPEGNFNGANLDKANLASANLVRADLNNASLYGANLAGAKLGKAGLILANLAGANLARADLAEADLYGANLHYTNLVDADLRNANLTQTRLVETKMARANVSGCRVYGIAAWNLRLDETKQTDLVITRDSEATVTVDDLEVAQFIYLLLRNEKLRKVIDTLTSKVVLILGRFSPQRKEALDAIRDQIRVRGLLPILFDFDKPSSRDLIETISTLAHMARFVIADLTDARSVLQELSHIVPGLPSLPVQPLLLTAQAEPGMFEHFKKYPWVLPVFQYRDKADLLENLSSKVIAPAEAKAKELAS